MEIPLKRPKLEPNDENKNSNNHNTTNYKNHQRQTSPDTAEGLEAIVALVEHRRKEVAQLTNKLENVKSQLEEAERKLSDAEARLAKVQHPQQQSQDVSKTTKSDDPVVKVKTERLSPSKVKTERMSPSPARADQTNSKALLQTKPTLLIPSAAPKMGSSMRSTEVNRTIPISSGKNVIPSRSQSHSENPKSKGDIFNAKSANQSESGESQERRPKRKLEQKEHMELIPSIRSSRSPEKVSFQSGSLISSQHKRKLRSLVLNPISEQLFATSALDGLVNLWQLQGKGLNASLLSTIDCQSPIQRRWPEDMTWHPYGDSLFLAYTADGGDNQVSIINLNVSKKKVTFLEDKPHIRGIVNSISFMPWDDLCFATGGSDHAVVMWTEKESGGGWKSKTLHRNQHSSAVMGVAGMQQKQIVLSAGADKRIVGFDARIARADFKHQLESKAMGVLPNPADFNLFMVQTGTPERQLRLFDIRVRQSEIHAFGWKQESSESQSALINQTWSPDGLYIASGSVDPRFHIFDIRYNSSAPSQSVSAHSKRVFKAAWHHSLPLVVSISSDLHIGLHKMHKSSG
ncbi:hypothetical protein KI387_000978 [Taxus chinensis]|uniref:Uncharacterized protein n=1 Tax=Taxus chinensis TaxID=29808 RepID=A0AA38GVW8_TAXCH|nr:hypothetical protein KI387_000978 [Taxus chinensis]